MASEGPRLLQDEPANGVVETVADSVDQEEVLGCLAVENLRV